MSCSRQLCRNSNTVIQPLARAPEHCVYICNLTYPPGLDETPTAAAAAAIAVLFWFYIFRLSFSLQASCPFPSPHRPSAALIIASFAFSRTQRYSRANTPTHFLTLTAILKHTKGLEDKPCVRSRSLNVSGPLQPAQFPCLLKQKKKKKKRFPILCLSAPLWGLPWFSSDICMCVACLKSKCFWLELSWHCECLNIHEEEGYMKAILSWMASSYELCHVSLLSTALCRAFISLRLCHWDVPRTPPCS